MLISLLILWPLLGIFIIYSLSSSYETNDLLNANLKKTALFFSLVEILISLIIWFLFDNTSKHFQFVQEQYTVGHYDIYLGLDGLSIYFVLLTTFIISISIISNWKSINENSIYFLVIMLLLESALLLVYSVLDILMFYVFFESILAPLFVLIGLFGSKDKHRAGFYLFLYTLLGSLFMLLSIITISSLAGSTDMDIINYTNYTYITQVFLFIGIFIAFAVKTPVIFLNSWLLKAHVESPLSGSVILAAIVLKLSLYGVFRLILPLVPKAFMYYTYIVFFICVITILYASFSTIRTIDVKELIAYSSVSHAVVYLGAVFSNVIQGIQGGILLGLAHGFVSSGLFICAGGILYDRSHTRTIYYYRGLAQIMPIFSILFFILCLGNCGTPLTLNFVGEFMSLYGIFERIPLAGMLASSSIVFSAAYTILLFNKTTLGGIFTSWNAYLTDVKLRECSILTLLVVFTVLAGIYPSIILDSLHYVTTNLLFTGVTYNDAIEPWSFFLQDDCTFKSEDLNYPVIIFLIMLPSIFVLSATTVGDYLETINDHVSMHYLTIEPYIGPIYSTLNVTFRLLLNTDLECSELYLCPFSDIQLESGTQLEPEWEGYCTMNWVDFKSEEERARMRDIRHEQEWIANRRGRIPTETIEVRSTLGLTNGKNSIHAMNDPTGSKIESITGIKPTIPSCNPNFGRGVLIESNSIVRESAKLVTMEPHNTFNPNWLNENTHPNKQITSNGKPLTCNISISPFGELIREWRDWAGTRSLSRVFGYSWNVFTMEENFRYAFDDGEKMREEMGGKRRLDSNTQPESQMGKKRKLDSDTQPESQMSRKRIK